MREGSRTRCEDGMVVVSNSISDCEMTFGELNEFPGNSNRKVFRQYCESSRRSMLCVEDVEIVRISMLCYFPCEKGSNRGFDRRFVSAYLYRQICLVRLHKRCRP